MLAFEGETARDAKEEATMALAMESIMAEESTDAIDGEVRRRDWSSARQDG